MRWDPNQSDLDKDNRNYIRNQEISIEPETTYEITINIAGSTKAAFGRYLGCIMFGFMPDEGLEEALFSLRDMLEFYRNKPKSHPLKIAPKAINASIGDKKKRPDLILTE